MQNYFKTITGLKLKESSEAHDEPERKKLKTEGEYFEVPEAKEDIKLDLELQNYFKTDFEDDLIPKKK